MEEEDETDITINEMNDDQQTVNDSISNRRFMDVTDVSNNNIKYDKDYVVPERFDTVEELLQHWYEFAEEKENRNGPKWRSHLNSGSRKRYTRMKRVVKTFEKVLLQGMSQYEICEKMECYYSQNKQSLAKLSDDYCKTL